MGFKIDVVYSMWTLKNNQSKYRYYKYTFVGLFILALRPDPFDECPAESVSHLSVWGIVRRQL